MEFFGDDFTSVAENFLESCSKDLELSGKFWNNPGLYGKFYKVPEN
jgi:hypothetical protein